MNNVPRPFPLAGASDKHGTVIIVGAGAAGLSAAHHLKNFGFQVRLSNRGVRYQTEAALATEWSVVLIDFKKSFI